jgi:Cation efflux family
MPSSHGAAFALGIVVNLALVVAEFGFGYLSNALALISDRVHHFTDVLSLLLPQAASWLGQGSQIGLVRKLPNHSAPQPLQIERVRFTQHLP